MKLLHRGRRRAPKPVKSRHLPLATEAVQVVHNLTVLADGTVLAGYRIGPARWDFTGNPAKQAALDAAQDGWASLVSESRWVQERVTNMPHPIARWAEKLDRRTPHPLPDVHTCDQSMPRGDLLDGRCGCETWNKHLLRMQAVIARNGMEDKVVFRYFSVGKVKPGTDVRTAAVAAQTNGTRPSDEVREVFTCEKRTRDAIKAQPGWLARRMTEREQQWLRARSLGIGIPAPALRGTDIGGWDTADMGALSNDVRWTETPFDRGVEVVAWREGKMITRHVQVLTCTRLADQRYPEVGLEPWQVYAERCTDSDGRPFPVEWNIVGRLVTGAELAARATLDVATAKHMRDGYAHFHELPPAYSGRGIERAMEIEDQVTTGSTRDAARFLGTINAVVFGEDVYDPDGRLVRTAAEQCEERGEAFRRIYGGNDLRMEFTVPLNQAFKLAEAVAGAPHDMLGYQRQVPLDYLAAGFPNVSASVGDGHGPYLGRTRGAQARPVQHDPHYATTGRGKVGRTANLWPVIGTLGAGKSVLIGTIAYNAVRRGVTTVLFDPSGPLARLCHMPEIAPWAHDMNVLAADDGILSPPALVRDPILSEFESPDVAEATAVANWQKALMQARQERSGLVQDSARRCLQADLYSHPATLGALRTAARGVDWTTTTGMFDLVDQLAELGKTDDHARDLRDALMDASQMPRLSLLFAPRGEAGDFRVDRADRKVLTVISTPGIKRAPDEVARDDWNPEELAANPITHLTSLYALSVLYGKPMSQPAVAGFDEAEFMTDGGTGRALLMRLYRDHSKWNTAIYLGLKSLDGFTGRAYVAGAFAGKVSSPAVADSVLSILNLGGEKGYARTLINLSSTVPGEFVHLDGDGRVGGLRIDVDFFPRLRETLLTTPVTEGADAWVHEEILG